GPASVPVQVEAAHRAGLGTRLAGDRDPAALAFLRDLSVILDARRCGREDESVLAVEVGVENDRDVVAVVDGDIANLFAGDDSRRIAVEQPGADVKRGTVARDAHLRSLAHGLTLS